LFVCLFSGTLEFNNMFCSFKGEGTGAVRHMFSHHILKPERTPLENCVWGNDKSSGTFYSLFKSRILKASAYLSKPFEIQVVNGQTTKRYCNHPVACQYVQDFDELTSRPNSCLVLNGDSSQLNLPDQSVDAIITDPPYFDFVNYSELADFFHAWLKPALKDEVDFFKEDHSTREGQVQNQDKQIFSSHLANVFWEGKRVLKDDGLLVFSFHHSRMSGWQAILDAVVHAGFFIEKAYPVKAEMSVAAPKNGSKSPIDIDALLVCKKAEQLPDEKKASALEHTKKYIERFAKMGRELSFADKKVIYLAQHIVEHSKKRVNGSLAGLSIKEKEVDQLVEQLTMDTITPQSYGTDKQIMLFGEGKR